MAAKSFDKRDNDKRAAVLVLLCTVNFKPSLLFMVRAGHLSQHAAQISFPGGHFEEDVDETLVDTALRETVEELVPVQQGNSQQHKHDKEAQPMLGPYRVSILGAATPLPSIRGVPVTPVVAALLDDELPDPVSTVFPGDSSEVDAIFSVSLEELLEKETSKPLPKSRFGFVDMGAPNYPSKYGDIWGLTAYIIRPLLHRLFKPVFFDKQT
jgi:8-oxo-dGTP pyrophosphatase MutT (NUDIX family)